MSARQAVADDDRIAIVGMAGRFPGADDVEALWELSVCGGSGVRRVSGRDGLVPYRGVVDGADRFDATFFGVPTHEAQMTDPQQRMLLEVAQHAFDDASMDPTRASGAVAVYAACAPTATTAPADSVSGTYEWVLATSADFAATRLSYRLGLRGESMTVQTGCSSSLVAVHLGVQALLSGQADVVLAGGVSFPGDQESGYPTEEGMIASPSGRCRPFDADADGTVPGGGAALVVLKRLTDAEHDGDRVHAVILGSGTNNDGSTKVGFMAPSPTGQAEAIATAHAVAGVDAGSIGYVETHGTGTQLGDEVEIEGLRRAFNLDPDRPGPCRLGSLKANCGHLDRAAGVAGLVRAVLALKHRTIPPMAGFERADPALDLDGAGFEVPSAPVGWETEGTPRRAGVSSFGVGGTNVHVVLEEAPSRQPAPSVPAGDVLLPLSGHVSAVVAHQATGLAGWLAARPGIDLGQVGRALSLDRRAREHRSWVVAGSPEQAAGALTATPGPVVAAATPTVVFAFPGQGEPVVDGMAELYHTEPVFRAALDECAEVIRNLAGFDIRADLYGQHDRAELARWYEDMSRFQPAQFAVEWATVELWRSWGVSADAVIGHSLGEIVAAVYAGVLSLADGLAFVVERSRRMEEAPLGETISVALPARDVEERLTGDLTVAAVNGHELTAVTGPVPQVAALKAELTRSEVFFRPLNIRRSPHGPAMREPARLLRSYLSSFALAPPTVRIVSNVTGDWIGDRIATPDYWATQLCSPVRFTDQLSRVAELDDVVVLVVGPGTGLGRMISHELAGRVRAVVASGRGADDPGGDRRAVLVAAGELWSHGVAVDLARLAHPSRYATALPPTCFDHGRRWPVGQPARRERSAPAGRLPDPGAWLYEPERTLLSRPAVPAVPVTIAWHGAPGAEHDAFLRAAVSRGHTLVPLDHVTSAPPSEGPRDVLWWFGNDPHDLLRRAAALADLLGRQATGTRVWLVTGDDGNGSGLSARNLAHAVARVLPQENVGCAWTAVTLSVSVQGHELDLAAGHLIDAVADGTDGTVLTVDTTGARRLGFRRSWPHWRARPLRESGCYVITGGLGPVGRAMALALAREVPATVVVLGRRAGSAVPDEVTALAARLREAGSRLEYRSVDVTDTAAVVACFADLRSRFGRIDGVVHAAGFTDRAAFPLAADAAPELVEVVAAAKMDGARAIHDALAPDDADFVLLCSSLSVVLGGVRFGPYVAANDALDEFAARRYAAGDDRWVSVGWDAWTDGDDAVPDPVGPARYALTARDGHEVFRRLLSVGGPVVWVSTGDLDARLVEVADQVGMGPQAAVPDGAVTTADPGGLVRAVLTELLGAVPPDHDRDLRLDGLESLAILQIVTRLRDRTGVRIALADALRSLSVTGLEALVSRVVSAPDRASGFLITPTPPAADHPTSSTQRRWLELLPEGYGGLDLAVEVECGYPAEQLVRAVERTIDRHGGLRTVFHRRGDTWRQSVTQGQPVKLVDLSAFTEAEQRAEISRLVQTAGDSWFDFGRTPPFEVTIARLAEGRRHAMLIHAHHVLFDGWSSSIFLRDVAEELDSEPGKAPLQYVDYAAAQWDYLHSPALLAARSYWREHFAGAPAPTRVPGDVGDGTGDAGDGAADDRGELLTFALGEATSAALRDRSAALGTTPFGLMMTAYAVLVHRLTGDDDLVLGTTAAGRPSAEAEEIVGVFVNPLPLRVQIDPGGKVGDLVSRVHHSLVGFHDHGNYPLEDLVTAVPPFIGLGLNDTFQCYLLYQNYWRPEAGTVRYQPMQLDTPYHHKVMRDWEIVLAEGEAGLTGELWYRTSRYSASWAEGCAASFRKLLGRFATDAEIFRSPVGALLDQ
ncbi:SDR family NAD(P)-dependent oxidoreductase [Micromonospora sp. NPDC001898]|uniref:SDR family NAD(P)-dependent oxidoreductase n=1 Tax=Micromonospora sp. NPDC001898 TaxID=3364221 RepID=UPI0036963040